MPPPWKNLSPFRHPCVQVYPIAQTTLQDQPAKNKKLLLQLLRLLEKELAQMVFLADFFHHLLFISLCRVGAGHKHLPLMLSFFEVLHWSPRSENPDPNGEHAMAAVEI